MNEKYFTERLFWLPDTDTLLHVSFMHGHGWQGLEICGPHSFPVAYRFATTYAELMSNFAHRSPELLLQEEW
jgi:hypothetical protein